VTPAVLLDENIPGEVAQGLRSAGYDVLTVAGARPGIDDRGVLRVARESLRVLLTFDADFGDLIFQRGEVPPPAVLYFRVHPVVAAEVLALALDALAKPIDGRFVVVTQQGVRTRPFDARAVDGRE
jgi:predicted nuclease of predicted toxin-antitoxin system